VGAAVTERPRRHLPKLRCELIDCGSRAVAGPPVGRVPDLRRDCDLRPYEVYELTKTITALRVLALVITMATGAYLLLAKRLFGLRGGGKAKTDRQRARTSQVQGRGAVRYRIPAQRNEHRQPARRSRL
jgi:hypothetical protein